MSLQKNSTPFASWSFLWRRETIWINFDDSNSSHKLNRKYRHHFHSYFHSYSACDNRRGDIIFSLLADIFLVCIIYAPNFIHSYNEHTTHIWFIYIIRQKLCLLCFWLGVMFWILAEISVSPNGLYYIIFVSIPLFQAFKKNSFETKFAYVCSVVTIIFLSNSVLTNQWLLPYYFTIATPILFLGRLYTYW